MVDPHDGAPAESRPPQLADLISLCRSLNREAVRYVVVGGMAMIQVGFVRATEDIDLLVDADRENLNRLRTALLDLPDKTPTLVEDLIWKTSPCPSSPGRANRLRLSRPSLPVHSPCAPPERSENRPALRTFGMRPGHGQRMPANGPAVFRQAPEADDSSLGFVPPAT